MVDWTSRAVTIDVPSSNPNEADALSMTTRGGARIPLFETTPADMAKARWVCLIEFEAQTAPKDAPDVRQHHYTWWFCPGSVDWRALLK
eukprot:525109-Rhodomonas_salina.1